MLLLELIKKSTSTVSSFGNKLILKSINDKYLIGFFTLNNYTQRVKIINNAFQYFKLCFISTNSIPALLVCI